MKAYMKNSLRNDLVPWPVVLIVLSALVLVCSSCLTLLADLQEVRATSPVPQETSEPVVIEDVTLPPREREYWSSATAAETQRPIGFYDSVITRLKYN